MEKRIILSGREISYTLKRSLRARSLRLTIYPHGEVVVSVPERMDVSKAEHFMLKKSKWILKKIDSFKKIPPQIKIEGEKRQLTLYKKQARDLVESRLRHFNAQYGFMWNRIAIRNQTSRWGSCSRKRNLNFNYKIALLPPELSDYIVVHELCHLGELNHGKRFWDLVSKTVPDYRERKYDLKRVHVTLS